MIKSLFLTAGIAALALPLLHPFGAVRQQRSTALLSGVEWGDLEQTSSDKPQDEKSGKAGSDSRVLLLFERACQNCHSERTQWPLYSHLPFVSWALEKDVADAREHLNLSRWDQYSLEQKRDLLARIGTEVRKRNMPLLRYTQLHPEALLSDADIQAIYEWTKAQRRAL